jgi:hypothetical protein
MNTCGVIWIIIGDIMYLSYHSIQRIQTLSRETTKPKAPEVARKLEFDSGLFFARTGQYVSFVSRKYSMPKYIGGNETAPEPPRVTLLSRQSPSRARP